MIRSFRHKKLKEFYEIDDGAGIDPRWRKRVRLILTRLDAAATPMDMALPGLRLHPLKGERKGFFAVDVSGNWRIVFRFDGEDVVDVDLIDYH